MVERWSYPNVLIYVSCPRDGEEHSQTLHRNYLLPIKPNLDQARDDTPVAGAEQMRASTPVPYVDSEPTDSELYGMDMLDMTGNMSQGSQDQPAPLRCGTHANTKPTSMAVPQFCTISRYQPAQHPGCMG